MQVKGTPNRKVKAEVLTEGALLTCDEVVSNTMHLTETERSTEIWSKPGKTNIQYK